VLPCGHPPACPPARHRTTFTTRFTDARALPGGSARWPGSPDRYQRAFRGGPSWSSPASRPPVVRATCADRTASFTRFEALIPLRVRSRRRRPGCPGFGPGSPRSLLETTPCEVAPSPPSVDALLSFTPPETSSRLGPCEPSPACDPNSCEPGPGTGVRTLVTCGDRTTAARRPARKRPDRVRPPHARPESHAGSTCSADTGPEPVKAPRRAAPPLGGVPFSLDLGTPSFRPAPGLRSFGALGRSSVSLSGAGCLSWGFVLLADAPRTRSRTHGRVERPCDRPACGFG
jgi:hypothetical protein